MAFVLNHPELIGRPCGECKLWVYRDDAKAKRLSCEKSTNRKGEPWPRGNAPTPCQICPKGNPERGQQIERELPRVLSVLQLFYESRATGGRCLTSAEATDAIVRRNLGIVSSEVSRFEAARGADLLLPVIIAAMSR